MTRKRHRSGYMPAELSELYEAAEENIELGDDIALIDSRIAQLLLQLKEGGTDPKMLATAMRQLEYAYASRSDDDLYSAMTTMRTAVYTSISERSIWEEINQFLESRRKFVMDETKRVIVTSGTVSYDQIAIAIERLMASIELHVKDPDIVRQIGTSFRKAMADGKLIAARKTD